MNRAGFLARLLNLWLLLALLELVLIPVVGHAGAQSSGWPVLICVVGNDLALALPFVLLVGAPFLLLDRLRAVSRSSWGRAGLAAGQVGLIWLALFAFGAHWATFHTVGQFLSWEGFLFWLDQPVQVFHWISPQLALLILFLTTSASLIFTWWPGPESPFAAHEFQRRMSRLATLVLGVCLIAALGFHFVVAGRLEADPESLLRHRDLVRDIRTRDYATGPFAFSVASFRHQDLKQKSRFPADTGIEVVRRPVVAMERYLDGIGVERRKPWNVVLVIVESLRSDQLLAYGATRNVMPSLNRLAAESRVFLNHYSQASHSNYAVLPPLSSHYPLRSRQASGYGTKPGAARVLIYDILKAAGYRTAHFSSQNEFWGGMINYLDTGNLDHIFHAATFDGPTYVMMEDAGFAHWVSETRHAGSVDDRHTMSSALDWIEAGNGHPFFLSMNLQSSHVPYVVPDDFPRPFGSDTESIPIFFGRFPRDRVQEVLDIYADSLNYVDAQLRRLFESLETAGLLETTVVVVTSDHGQAFYEHGFASHAGRLYDEVMRVPLIIRAPGLDPGTDDRPAQHVDVAPTILDLLDLPSHPAHQGVSLITADGQTASRSIYMVVQTALAYQHALVRDGRKLIFDERQGGYELYFLRDDPGELDDRAPFESDLVRVMAGRLHRWYEEQVAYYTDRATYRKEYPPILSERE